MSGRHVLPFALVAALVVVADGGQRVQAQESNAYPSWFRTTPPGPSVLWAVGYAPAYSSVTEGVDEAKKDAYESLRRARRVVILGEKLYEKAPGYGTAQHGKAFAEIGLPDTLRSVSYVDSLNAGGMTLVLAAVSEDSIRSRFSSTGRRVSFSKTRPAWVQEGMTGALDGQRAMGVAPRYYNLENSWRLAEKRARRKLAFKAASKVENLSKDTEDWQHDVQSVTTGVDLRDVQVLERWGDDKNCYVLIEGRVEDVLVK